MWLISMDKKITNFQTRTSKTKDDWQTPLHIVESLGVFDLDPCANSFDRNRCAMRGYVFSDDGLMQSWSGRVWLNPPYGKAAKLWLKKLANHGNGIALIPPRMGAIWFHDIVLESADAILFIKRRIPFINADSCLVAFGADNVSALYSSGIDGSIWRINI